MSKKTILVIGILLVFLFVAVLPTWQGNQVSSESVAVTLVPSVEVAPSVTDGEDPTRWEFHVSYSESYDFITQTLKVIDGIPISVFVYDLDSDSYSFAQAVEFLSTSDLLYKPNDDTAVELINNADIVIITGGAGTMSFWKSHEFVNLQATVGDSPDQGSRLGDASYFVAMALPPELLLEILELFSDLFGEEIIPPDLFEDIKQT
jgi:hypothetical protein